MSFGQRKQEIDRGLIGKVVLASQRGVYGFDVVVGEPVGFQVGQAPIAFAVLGAHADALAVGLDGFFLVAECLERMAGAE